MKIYEKFFKRPLDFCATFVGIIIISPILMLVSLLLCLSNRGTPFFFQQRPGRDGRIFTIVKFKTMNDARGPDGLLRPDHERLTTVGRWVRKLSLDELPQLFNVLKGDMSLIGPRPLLPQYLPLYSAQQRRRHDVRPGITGWAQVNGRNAIDWKTKFELDVYYVDHLSCALDIKILWLTLYKVFKASDINASAQTTMEPFNGNN